MSAKKPAAPRTRRAPWIAFGLSAAAFVLVMSGLGVAFAYGRGAIPMDREDASRFVGGLVLTGAIGVISTALVGASRLPTSNPKWPAIMCIANVPILMLFFGVLSLIKQMG